MLKNPAVVRAASPRLRFVWYVLIATTLLVWLQSIDLYGEKLQLALSAPTPQQIQVFCDQGAGFREDTSRLVTTPPVNGIVHIDISLAGNCHHIRLDPGSTGAVVTLYSATLSSLGLQRNVLDAILKGNKQQLDVAENPRGGATFSATGDDPFVVLDGDFSQPVSVGLSAVTLKYAFLLIGVVLLLAALDYLIAHDGLLATLVLGAVLLRLLGYSDAQLPLDTADLHAHWHDEGSYFHYVQQMLSAGVLPYFRSLSSIEAAPGNVLYLSALFSLFDGSVGAVRLFNLCVLSIAIVVATFKIGSMLFSRKAAAIAATLVAIYPELIDYAPALLTEYPFIALLLVFVYAALKVTEDSATQASFSAGAIFWIAVGAAAGVLASITRLIVLPTILLWLAYALYLYRKDASPRRALRLAVLMMSILVGIFPFLQNGHRHSGSYMIATGSGVSLWLGSRLDTDGDDPPYRKKSYDTQLVTHGNSYLSLQGDKMLREAALRNIADHPADYAMMAVKKLGRLMVGNSYQWFVPASTFGEWAPDKSCWDRFTKLFSIFIAAAVALFSLAFPLVFRKEQHQAAVVYLIALALIATYLPFMVNVRYGLPIFVLLTPFAAHTAISIARRSIFYPLILLTLAAAITALVAKGML